MPSDSCLLSASTGNMRKDRENFPSRLDTLLAFSGQSDAASVTDTVGCNIREKSFWLESLSVIEKYVDEFVSLVEESLS